VFVLLVRQQQDEHDVQVAETAEGGAEPHHVHDDGADNHHRRHPPAEPPVEPDRGRGHANDHEVDEEEPQRPERQRGRRRKHPAQELRVAQELGAGRAAEVRKVHRDLDHQPEP